MFHFRRKLVNTFHAMSSFTQILNPITGSSEWQQLCDNYDYHQEVARSAFADMLHDTERNQKYFAALKKVISNLHQQGKQAHVLDIGTGTGILSMMAVTSGADTVTACEAFLPMADCAEKIIEMNGMSNKIKLIKKRSTDIKIGPNNDMEHKANILVTEVFDTELIGEGAIGIFNHAHEQLLTEDSIVIPQSSTCYVQIIESPLAITWNKPKLLANLDGEVLLKPPPEINECQGECAVHDIQLSQISLKQFNSLVEPFPIFEFNWNSKNKMEKRRINQLKLNAIKNGTAHVVFFWWDLKMDPDEKIVLSCAPYWAHPDFKELSKHYNNDKPIQNCIPWRDHWMQALYYLPKSINLNKDQEFYFSGNHDEYSFWFDAWLPSSTSENKEEIKNVERLKCTCSLHLIYSRSRIGQMNNHLRNKKYLSIIEDVIDKNSNVLCLSDGSLIGLSTAALNAKSVICLEPHTLSYNVMQSYINYNKLKNIKLIKKLDDINNYEEITHIIGEPNFITSILPWDNFYFGTLINKIKNKLNSTNNVQVLPTNGNIWALPVEFLDLHKIRSPLDKCEGFNLSYFDKFVDKSSQLADANVEAQPLWEYPCKVLGEKKQILQVDFKEFDKNIEQSGLMNINFKGNCNGIALWVDWDLNGSGKDKYIVSTGPTQSIELGKYVSWDMYTKQGVHLFPKPKNVTEENNIKWEITFKPKEGDLRFKFEII